MVISALYGTYARVWHIWPPVHLHPWHQLVPAAAAMPQQGPSRLAATMRSHRGFTAPPGQAHTLPGLVADLYTAACFFPLLHLPVNW
jgi:hypothetical protein